MHRWANIVPALEGLSLRDSDIHSTCQCSSCYRDCDRYPHRAQWKAPRREESALPGRGREGLLEEVRLDLCLHRWSLERLCLPDGGMWTKERDSQWGWGGWGEMNMNRKNTDLEKPSNWGNNKEHWGQNCRAVWPCHLLWDQALLGGRQKGPGGCQAVL